MENLEQKIRETMDLLRELKQKQAQQQNEKTQKMNEMIMAVKNLLKNYDFRGKILLECNNHDDISVKIKNNTSTKHKRRHDDNDSRKIDNAILYGKIIDSTKIEEMSNGKYRLDDNTVVTGSDIVYAAINNGITDRAKIRETYPMVRDGHISGVFFAMQQKQQEKSN